MLAPFGERRILGRCASLKVNAAPLALTTQFAREFIREVETGASRRVHLLNKAEAHPIEKVGARLRRLMSWK